MVRERVACYRDRVRRELTAAFREEHTEHEVAISFAIGVFVTTLPTGGLGIGLFLVLVSVWSWISKPALFASVAVLNPFIKPVVYVASFQVGGVFVHTPSLESAGSATETARFAVRQLLVGNVVVAFVLAAVGYLLVFHLISAHRERKRRGSGPT
ncbi:DUF2062 domain-containing protein [Natrarchaeobaculum sulfurireducens]|uniref:DUF2062 domain-containing protein n=1 Tax=Natrarchaeobaculum sulfurireducens TaxID=2044521 RepID=A0A346PH58_9EURY|nr:DUF2062 domain-containing protein [Natrarchaeobaculum sulfurireducens]AXR78853.1 hypothetical protein AArc1_2538 [Natrarchaeobaculum sulfurireducens]AXR81101.1 hypothetical protein AArcMg_1085 [Natrarchaeobaculum sulfurireducens]